MPRFRLRQVLLCSELLHVLYISRDIIRSYDGLRFKEVFIKFLLSGFLNRCQMNDRLGKNFYKKYRDVARCNWLKISSLLASLDLTVVLLEIN
jgi:hypothetical protein